VIKIYLTLKYILKVTINIKKKLVESTMVQPIQLNYGSIKLRYNEDQTNR